jgi:hypothetical protein
MRIIKWLAVIAPAATGLMLDILLSRGIPDIPILYLRADLGVFLLRAGCGLTFLCAGVAFF